MNDGNENGEPIMMMKKASHQQASSSSLEQDAFRRLADHVSQFMLLTQYGHPDNEKTLVRFKGETTTFPLESILLKLQQGSESNNLTVRLVSSEGATQQSFKPVRLRNRDPATGELIPDSPFLEQEEEEKSLEIHITHSSGRKPPSPNKPSPSLKPVKVERRGRYGYAVEWADGATIIYSFQCIAIAANASILHTSH
jgi:hypothetical protein